MKIKELFTKKYIAVTISMLAAILLIITAVVLAFLWPKNEQGDSSSDVISDFYSSWEYISSEISSEIISTSSVPAPELEITSHKNTDITTVNPFTVFSGKSDPTQPLYLNGVEIERDALGNFTIEQELKVGANEFKFSHKEKEKTYIVRYRYKVINSYSPAENKSFSSGASFAVTVSARRGSTVTASFNGSTITLKPSNAAGGDDEQKQDETFITYSGSFTLPSDNVKNLSLGKVTFSAVCGEYSEKTYSGTITCKAAKRRTVGEIVAYSAETFNGDTSDDASRPTNNYFPKGTVDYVVGRAYHSDKEYLILRCGRRVYVDKKIVPGGGKSTVSKEYVGKLPDTNALSVASLKVDNRFTTLTLNTEWKAPFFLDVLPQSYGNPATQDYTISAFTANYVEITFCYARAFSGGINFDQYNPVFKSAEVIKKSGNTVLRLYLRKTGTFYGWDASYNSDGQLVFKFLHPAQVTKSNNPYGADLSNVKILIDVGHGGIDPGAGDYSGKYSEKERNLTLALKLKAELQKTGATVILNRNGDTTLTADTRCQNLKLQYPDLCVAIHHDSSASARPNGFGSFYSTPFSFTAARFVYNRTIQTGIYNASAANNRNRCEWHYYYMARMSNCPVVLTENGFMSNVYDMSHIISDASVAAKAKAIAQGVADYFLSIRHDLPVPPSEEPSSSSTDESAPPSSSSVETSSESSSSSGEESSSDPSSSSNEETPSDPPSSSDEELPSGPPSSSGEELPSDPPSSSSEEPSSDPSSSSSEESSSDPSSSSSEESSSDSSSSSSEEPSSDPSSSSSEESSSDPSSSSSEESSSDPSTSNPDTGETSQPGDSSSSDESSGQQDPENDSSEDNTSQEGTSHET